MPRSQVTPKPAPSGAGLDWVAVVATAMRGAAPVRGGRDVVERPDRVDLEAIARVLVGRARGQGVGGPARRRILEIVGEDDGVRCGVAAADCPGRRSGRSTSGQERRSPDPTATTTAMRTTAIAVPAPNRRSSRWRSARDCRTAVPGGGPYEAAGPGVGESQLRGAGAASAGGANGSPGPAAAGPTAPGVAEGRQRRERRLFRRGAAASRGAPRTACPPRATVPIRRPVRRVAARSSARGYRKRPTRCQVSAHPRGGARSRRRPSPRTAWPPTSSGLEVLGQPRRASSAGRRGRSARRSASG